MAAAGEKAGKTAAPAGGAQYTIKSLGIRPARSVRRTVAVAAVAALLAGALLAAGGAALVSLSRPSGHAGSADAAGPADATPSSVPARPSAVPATSSRAKPRAVPTSAHRVSPASPARQRPGMAASQEIVGVGCPGDGEDTVTLDNAPTGPGWQPAGGGWTGDGCDGSTLWTMDPNRHQPAPSSLTWIFSPTPGVSRCTLAVFVPTQNALGVSEYTVSSGPPAPGRALAVVPVSQAAEAGQWLTLGTFPLSGSPLEITASPVPDVPGPGHHGAISASAARARCT